MEPWQQNLLTAVVTATISGIGGWWAHWKWAKQERLKIDLEDQRRRDEHAQKVRDLELREQQLQTEHEDLKRKRRMIGAGEVEKMERADKLLNLIIKLKEHRITEEEFDRLRAQLVGGKKQRHKPDISVEMHEIRISGDVIGPIDSHNLQTALTLKHFLNLAPFDARLTQKQKELLAQKLFSVLEQKGPNGYPVGFDVDGAKVEWVPSEPEDVEEGADPHSPIPLLRDEEEILAAQEEFFEKVWWNRHQIWLEKIERGEETLKPEQVQVLETAKAAAKRIEEKYGVESLGWDDFEWGMVNGKLSALRWVGGSEWDFLDT